MKGPSAIAAGLVVAGAILLAGPPRAASFGPVAWSPDGEAVASYRSGRIWRLPRIEGGGRPLTDSIPPPAAIGADWGAGILAVSLPGRPPLVPLYDMGTASSTICLRGIPGPAECLRIEEGWLTLAGAGYVQRRRLPDGAITDSLRWEPALPPLSLGRDEGRDLLLLRERVVCLGGDSLPVIRELPGGGIGIASLSLDGGNALLLLRGADVLLLRPDGTESAVAFLEEGERLLGASLSPGGRLLLLAVAAHAPASYPSRVDIREVATGELVKRFRSARVRREREIYEEPAAGAFDPTGRSVVVVWPSAGTQIWSLGDWALSALYR